MPNFSQRVPALMRITYADSLVPLLASGSNIFNIKNIRLLAFIFTTNIRFIHRVSIKQCHLIFDYNAVVSSAIKTNAAINYRSISAFYIIAAFIIFYFA